MTPYGRPLLAELHAHTTWSDGALSPRELVDLYGRAGFDVLAITDHVVHSSVGVHVTSATYDAYLHEIEAEAERARSLYDLLVMPGLELTVEDPDPRRAGHAVAVGLRRFVSVDDGLGAALVEARTAGAALIAAHPYPLAEAAGSHRGTACFAENPEWAHGAVDRFELFNRHERFGWVADRRFPAVATGDFHVPDHLFTWKTLLDCKSHEASILGELRCGSPCRLLKIDVSSIAA